MNRLLAISALGGLAISGLAISGQAVAATVIDQIQTSHPSTVALISSGGLAQSFQQAAGDIAGAGIFLSANGLGPAAITISLWDALPTDGGTQLAAANDTTYANSHWFDVFWTPVAIAANHTYYLVITQAFSTSYGVAGDFANPYSRGHAFANGYNDPAALDYAFRTYSDPSYVPPVATAAPGVPEPAAWALMILGLGTAGAALRRRRATPAAA